MQIVIAMIQIFFGQLRVSLPGASGSDERRNQGLRVSLTAISPQQPAGEVMYATSTLCFGVACIATAWLYMRISQIGHF